MTTTTQILKCPTSNCSSPASAKYFVEQIYIRDVLTGWCDPVQHVQSLQPISNQTSACLKVYLQSLDLKNQFQLFAQRGREAVNDQRETARSALLQQQRKNFAATYLLISHVTIVLVRLTSHQQLTMN